MSNTPGFVEAGGVFSPVAGSGVGGFGFTRDRADLDVPIVIADEAGAILDWRGSSWAFIARFAALTDPEGRPVRRAPYSLPRPSAYSRALLRLIWISGPLARRPPGRAIRYRA